MKEIISSNKEMRHNRHSVTNCRKPLHCNNLRCDGFVTDVTHFFPDSLPPATSSLWISGAKMPSQPVDNLSILLSCCNASTYKRSVVNIILIIGSWGEKATFFGRRPGGTPKRQIFGVVLYIVWLSPPSQKKIFNFIKLTLQPLKGVL